MTALLLGSLAVAALPSPAAAHTRYITDFFYGGLKGDEEGLRANPIINREHAGVMKVTLFKRVNGNWESVKTKRALKSEVSPTSYSAIFAEPNASRCKFRAKFTTEGHNTSQKSTPDFGCETGG
jgi:hypothetical protein